MQEKHEDKMLEQAPVVAGKGSVGEDRTPSESRDVDEGVLSDEAPSNAKDVTSHGFKRLQDSEYMKLAIEQAKLAAEDGEVPIGAVVVHQPFDKATRRATGDAQVVGVGRNMRETIRDASAHAEFLAMQQAMETLDAWRLTDCTVYVTLEPCIMCAGLMQQSRIARCVYGASDLKAGACGSLYDIGSDLRLNHRFEVESGILEQECAQLLRDFFKSKR